LTIEYISQHIINKHHYNSILILGKLNELVYDCKPSSEEEWYNYYINYLKSSNKIDKLNEIINNIVSSYNVDKKLVKQSFKKRCITDVYNGYIRESEAHKLLQKEYPECVVVKTSDKMDRKLGIDFLIYTYEGVLISGIQIKPISYFKGWNTSLNRDKQINKEKYAKFSNIHKVPVYEMSYDNGNIGEYENKHDI
jgi:hypothetical protein